MSTHRRIYLDFNATAPLAETARAAMLEAMAVIGNPSSIHAEGRRMRDLVERARHQVAQLACRPVEQVVFTSGGTEANALGVMAHAREVEAGWAARRAMVAREPRGDNAQPGITARAYVARIDHPSLVGAVAALRERGWIVVELDVNGGGEIRLPALDEPFGLLALAAVNHELGTIANVREVSEFAASARRKFGHEVRVHVDAVQAAGKIDLSAWSWADSIAISGHKLGGPQGVGALAISGDNGFGPVPPPNALIGTVVAAGHQERGRRPGTENTLGIVGFGAAAAGVDTSTWPRVAALGDRLEAGLRAMPGVRIHGSAARIGGTINAGFAGALGQSIVIALDLEGIAASTGAACTSGSVQPSPVLLALGLTPKEAQEAVRFSLGRSTTEQEVDAVLAALPPIVERVRKFQ